jgi:CRP-like cAMP-binding protein
MQAHRRTERAPSNRLIESLPSKDRERLVAGCVPVALSLAEIVGEAGRAIRYVHFPSACFISLSSNGNPGSFEVALIGDEGMLGLPLALGIEAAHGRALVQGGGAALRMSAARFKLELKRSPALRRTVSRYVFVLMSQLGLAVACNRFHVVEQRLARWLLMTADRAHSASFSLTQVKLASMLGVRRVGITKAASVLQGRKLIKYSRGSITILDRDGLEKVSCGCYQADIDIYEKTFGKAKPH